MDPTNSGVESSPESIRDSVWGAGTGVKKVTHLTPTGKPPPLAVRLAKALPFRRAQREMRDALTAPDDLHMADGAHACARVGVVSDHMAKQGRRYDTYAMAAGVSQGLQALSPRQWPPLGAFIKLPALRVVHDFPPRAMCLPVDMDKRHLQQRVENGEIVRRNSWPDD